MANPQKRNAQTGQGPSVYPISAENELCTKHTAIAGLAGGHS